MSMDSGIRAFVTAVANRFNSERSYNLSAALQGVATAIGSKVGPIWDALALNFGLIDGYDVRLYGAVGNGVVDDTAAIQAALDAAGAEGITRLPGRRVFRVTSPLILGSSAELVGAGPKSSEIRTGTDITAIRSSSGQAQAVRGIMVRNTVSSTRATFDIEFVNPTKVVLSDVEVSLPNNVGGQGGGIRFWADSGLPGKAFMPQLNRVWVRNGHLVAENVTDGHVSDCYIWGSAGSPRAGAINLLFANAWSFSTTDVVPTQDSVGGAGYYLNGSFLTNITGGYIDGSYADNITGYGLRAVNSGQISMNGTSIFYPGRSAILLENTNGSTFSALAVERANKANGGYFDFHLVNSSYNTFLGTVHMQTMVRSNPGGVFLENSSSTNNLFDGAVVDRSKGDQYAYPLFVGKDSTMGPGNRPASLWPKPASSPSFIVPPSCLYTGSTIAWGAADRAQFHRFYVQSGAVYQYTGFRAEASAAGVTVQAAIVKMDGLNWTRVTSATSTSVTGPGNISIDMGARYLEPGEYALVLWSSSTALQVRATSGEWIRPMRIASEQSLPGGIPQSGTLAAWSTDRAVTGMSITVTSTR